MIRTFSTCTDHDACVVEFNDETEETTHHPARKGSPLRTKWWQFRLRRLRRRYRRERAE